MKRLNRNNRIVMKRDYKTPQLRSVLAVIEAGFTVSSSMDDDSPVKDLEWD